MGEELLPCPFCGCSDIALVDGADMDGWDNDVTAHMCSLCLTIGPTTSKGACDSRLNWNTRATLTVDGAIIERMQGRINELDGERDVWIDIGCEDLKALLTTVRGAK
jgi:hypothetical protein